jgi:predicted helicase
MDVRARPVHRRPDPPDAGTKHLVDGLADTSKVTVDWDTGTNHPKTGKPVTEKRQVHKVQILDPATGTGTFLAKAVQLISDRVKVRAPGKWSGYVEQELLPRLHGFELLMASYAMCHMKLDMMLTETGYKPSANPPRLSVWLTNALEPPEREVRDLFFQPLAEEARGASEVKRQTPIMCVIGNPPYSSSSQNTGAWITDLIEDYKYTAGEHFREVKHWLHDDYVKFLRMAEEAICRTGSGVVAMITNHGFLENPTFRGMRFHLLETFDRIYILDLHGNTTKGETPPEGVHDTNVFDIQQGVSVAVFVRTSDKAARRKRGVNNKIGLAELFHAELWGSRKAKGEQLFQREIGGPEWTKLEVVGPYYFFVPKDFRLQGAYSKGFSLVELMQQRVTGVITARDGLAVDFDNQTELRKLQRFVDPSRQDADVRAEFFGRRSGPAAGDSRGWKLADARQKLAEENLSALLKPVDYRPFDRRSIAYTPLLVDWGREEFMRHMTERPNIALVTCRQGVGETWDNVFVSDTLGDDSYISNRSRERGYFFHLYLISGRDLLDSAGTINFDPKLYAAICKAGGIDPADRAAPGHDFRAAIGDARPSEVKVFDYIYGVLHSPDYRAIFAEFLKIDFPRIPFPSTPEVFRRINEKGEQLRRLHLIEPAAVGETSYPYQGDGDDIVANGYPKFDKGKVLINEEQYFAGVGELAWNLRIGGYQPAQKWLKDRRGRALSWSDIGHYQRMVKILTETGRIMGEIELPIDLEAPSDSQGAEE